VVAAPTHQPRQGRPRSSVGIAGAKHLDDPSRPGPERPPRPNSPAAVVRTASPLPGMMAGPGPEGGRIARSYLG